MRSRSILAITAMFAFVGIATAEPPSPAAVIQLKPVSRLLSEYREAIKQVGGKTKGEDLVKEFDKELKEALGEKGLEGIDINRPIAAYVVLKDEPDKAQLTVLVPITTDKDFIALLERMELKVEAVKDNAGLYKLEGPNELFPNASYVRFTNAGWAYVSLNQGEPTDAKDLISVGNLIGNADPALVSAKFYPGRVPEKFIKTALDQLDESVATIKGFLAGAGPEMKLPLTFLEQGPKLLRRYAEQAVKEASEVGLKFGFDPMTGDTTTELKVIPKDGTALAKEIAAKPPTASRLAAIIPKDAAVGFTVQAPLFAKELREIVGALFGTAEAGLADAEIPEAFQPLVKQALKGLTGSVKAGKLDAAVALVGPNKDGKFTFMVGLSMDETAALEKVARATVKASEFAKEFEFDVVKVGDVGVHKIPFARLLPEDAENDLAKIFGDKLAGATAFAKDAVIFAFGPDAVDSVKTALEAKPIAAPVLEITGNAAKLHKLATAIDPMAAGMFAEILGTEDKQVTAMRVTVEGGKDLTIKAVFNVRYLPKLAMGAIGIGGGAAQPFPQAGVKGAIAPPPPVLVPAPEK